jgi:Asp-tRNA(Asn)/Glu-tRNA(Gln) amidotransferase B subunit
VCVCVRPCVTGGIEVVLPDGSKKTVGITRAHIEEDAGKLLHSPSSATDASLVDYNRGGARRLFSPLITPFAHAAPSSECRRTDLGFNRPAPLILTDSATKMSPAAALRRAHATCFVA